MTVQLVRFELRVASTFLTFLRRDSTTTTSPDDEDYDDPSRRRFTTAHDEHC